ncbi:MAG TPA: hypothetical protein V6D19_03515 [Stenomitos sp.]
MKGKCLYGFFAASVLLVLPLIAEARLAANGENLNGVSLNGIDLNTSQTTPTATNSMIRVEGGQLVIQSAPIAQ